MANLLKISGVNYEGAPIDANMLKTMREYDGKVIWREGNYGLENGWNQILAGFAAIITGTIQNAANGVYGSRSSGGVTFGSDAKSAQKLSNQMNSRGWTENSVQQTVNSPYTTRISTNLATGNSATVYYAKNGAYVVVDDVTKAVVQVSDFFNPQGWIPDANIINPYKP